MNRIKLIVILLKALQVLCAVEELRSLDNCGWTPSYAKSQIVGGQVIEPDEFSWIASLEYGSQGYGYCAGSVISSRYVLTAAHCVTGEQVKNYGGLTGVRLGNFSQEPYCDYGTPNCRSYQRFAIEDIKVHENYGRDRNHIFRNDIALLRLDKPIIFGRHMKRVCLPFDTEEPTVDTELTVAGWGRTSARSDSTAKRAVVVPLLDKGSCEYQDDSVMCAAKLAETDSESKKTCEGNSGGPLMHAVNERQMVIEGIVSYGQSTCGNRFFPTYFTRVRHYLSWIEEKVCTASGCTFVAREKFPTDCGYSPMYPKAHTSDGHSSIRPDEYSWTARLVYEKELACIGSVIHSRYVLTSARCLSDEWIDQVGELIGVRLGDFDDSGHICDYGLANCTHYQEFGIEKIMMHDGYRVENHEVDNIGLIRLNRSIEFGPKMKPICLPFGIYEIPEPRVGSSLTVTAWLHVEDDSVAKREAEAPLWKEELCKEVKYPWISDQICSSNLCIGGYGSPLMYSPFARQRMVLEGILSTGSNTCRDWRDPVVYTRVRSYRYWLLLRMIH